MSVKEVKEHTYSLNVTVFLNFISLASQRKGINKPMLTVKETKYGLGQFTYANSQHPVNCSAAQNTLPAPAEFPAQVVSKNKPTPRVTYNTHHILPP